MADKTCSSCGATLPAAAHFCTQCGSRDLTEAAPAGTPPAPEPEPTTPVTPDAPTTLLGEVDDPPRTVPAADAPPPPGEPTPVAEAPAPPPPAEPAEPPPPPAEPAEPAGAETTTPVDPTVAFAPPPTAETWASPPAPTMTDTPTAVLPPPAPTPTPPGAAPAPAAATSATGGGRFGALIVLIGGAAAIVGAFLDWMTIDPEGGERISLTGWTLSDDAKIVLVLGAVAVIASVIVLGGMLRGVVRVLAAALGIVTIALGGYDLYDIIEDLPDSLQKAGVSGVEISAPDLGLILVIAGGAVMVLGALGMTAPKGTPAAAPAAAPAPAPMPGPAPQAAPPSGYGPPPGPSGHAPPPAPGT